MRCVFIFFMTITTTSSSLPYTYDLRVLYPACRAFAHIFDQGSCASCCAAAAATQLSLRQCMSPNRTDKLYSAQQIWDCAASSAAGSCAEGVYLDTMLAALGVGVRSARSLVDEQCAAPLQMLEPNISRCLTNNTPCATQSADLIGGVASYDLSHYYVGIEYASQMASHALMNEIYTNGPVLAVLAFVSTADFVNFGSYSFLKGGRVFMPNATGWSYLKRHCVVVLGWGTDAQSGHNYWVVQNSYGDQWADGGFARILRGADLLEGEWRGLFFGDTMAAPPSLVVVPLSTPRLMPSGDIVFLTFMGAFVLAILLTLVRFR
jgi:hypothetical protein